MNRSTLQCRVDSLALYPVKSAQGIVVQEAVSDAHGLKNDRRFMLVNEQGRFVSQREYPILTQLGCHLTAERLVLTHRAHSMDVALHDPERRLRSVSVWRDALMAEDCGDGVAAWLSAILNAPVRLVQFGSQSERYADRQYAVDAPVAFSDGFPILVTTRESLAVVNDHVGVELEMSRFRPNVVLSGLPPFIEDDIESIEFEQWTLRLVKPCARCSIPGLNPATGQREHDPFAWLKANRWDATVRGATFGSNAVLAQGIGRPIRVGEIGLVLLKND